MKHSRPKACLWLACLLVLAPWNVPAAIYKQVLPDGTVSYSSDPAAPDAEPIDPPPLQIIPEAEPLPDMDTQDAASEPDAPYTYLSIEEPADDQVIWNNEQTVGVRIALEPRLRNGHRLELLLDGKPVDVSPDTLSMTLGNVDRGTHTLTAEVRDARGSVLMASPPVTFHLKQHSVLQPPRAAPK